MITSSLLVETTPGKLRPAAKDIESIAGVIVHNFEGFKILVTVTAESNEETNQIVSAIESVDGVFGVSVIYSGLES